MLNLNQSFGWAGIGLVRDIIRQKDGLVCRLSIIHQVKSPQKRPDEVWLNCKIEDKALLQLFSLLECDFHIGRTILLKFFAEYISFESAQFDQDKGYQNHLLQFNAKMLAVESCLINGQRFDFDTKGVGKKAA